MNRAVISVLVRVLAYATALLIERVRRRHAKPSGKAVSVSDRDVGL